ncbi:MAG: monofunctional biosynthetic peptidoglycan transglycosylase [Nitrospirae bacterium]|nr:monofunctional biosynthetic peptidoglycan transglycosylase [Nitrospirota bacterium]
MKREKKTLFKRIIVFSFAVLSVFIAFQFVYPNVSKLKKENPRKTAFMEYREEEWASEGKRYKIQQVWVPYRAISPYLIKAVLIGEDDKFWQHEGFDYDAMQKAIEKDIKAKKFKLGGSTISQQLAKNLYLSPSKNPLRKIREALITWRMERALTKKRILEIYLNIAEWGDRGIFGIEAAARSYYGTSAAALGPEEAARLAAVLPNPRKFNPLGTSRYVVNRSALIYSIMVRRGIVVPEYDEMEMNSSRGAEDHNNAPDTPIEAIQPSSR